MRKTQAAETGVPLAPGFSSSGEKRLTGGRVLRALVIVAAIGLATGVLQALLGIGGGAVIVPALVFWAGFSQKEAQAASLWYVVPTSLFAGVLYASRGHIVIEISYVEAMAAAAVVGALIGAPLVKKIRPRQLQQFFGCAMLTIAAIMVWRSCTGNIVAIQDDPDLQYLVVTWTGLIAGFLSSLLGIGGGVLVVPALVLVGAFEQKIAQGMSLFCVVPTALASALLYRYHVKIEIDIQKITLMVTTGLVGAYFGWLLVDRTPSAMLRIVFAAGLAAMSILIVLRARRERAVESAPDWII